MPVRSHTVEDARREIDRARSCARRPGVGAGRRSGFRGVGGGGPPAFSPQGVAASDQIAWHNQTLTDDGAGNVNPYVDDWTGEDLTNATAGNRPNLVADDPDFGGRDSASFNGTSDVQVAPTGTEADWKPGHDGTGVNIGLDLFCGNTAAATQIIYTTMTTISAASIGGFLQWDQVAQNVDLQIANGVAWVIRVSSAPGSVTANARHRFAFSYKHPDWALWMDGLVLMSGQVVLTPSSSNPTQRLFVGAASAARRWTGKLAENLWFKGNPVTPQLMSYLMARP